jgi:hypothetical protein
LRILCLWCRIALTATLASPSLTSATAVLASFAHRLALFLGHVFHAFTHCLALFLRHVFHASAHRLASIAIPLAHFRPSGRAFLVCHVFPGLAAFLSAGASLLGRWLIGTFRFGFLGIQATACQ